MSNKEKWREFFINERKNVESFFAPNLCSETEDISYEKKVIDGKPHDIYYYKTEFISDKENDLPNELHSVSIIKTSIKKGKTGHVVSIEKITIIDNEKNNKNIKETINTIESQIIPCKSTDIKKIMDILNEQTIPTT